MMGFLDVENWRDVGSVSSACWAGVLGDRAVNVGQNSGLTARNPSLGEVTAIDQSPDHARGDAQTPRDPGLRNPRTRSLEPHEPHKRIELSLTSTTPDRSLSRMQTMPGKSLATSLKRKRRAFNDMHFRTPFACASGL